MDKFKKVVITTNDEDISINDGKEFFVDIFMKNPKYCGSIFVHQLASFLNGVSIIYAFK